MCVTGRQQESERGEESEERKNIPETAIKYRYSVVGRRLLDGKPGFSCSEASGGERGRAGGKE